MEPFAWVLLYGVCFQGAIFGVSWAWSVTVPREMEGMVGSCLVIPCRFSYSEYPPNEKGRVVWYQYVDRGYPLACDPKFANEVIEKFRGKTSLYRSPYKGDCSLKIDPLDWRHQEERVYPWVDPDYEQNCTLEIDEVKPHDNGPFCFRAEKGMDKYTFNNSCVFIVMKASPSDPVMTPLPEETEEGSALSATCSVEHTCPTHPPTFTWNVKDGKTTTSHTQISRSTWKTSSTLTFIPAGDNYEEQLTCSATFWRRKRQDSSASLNVKRKQSLLPTQLPATSVSLLALALCVGVVMIRKRCSRCA
ncbi:myelin-associated glycoprotein-like [Anguilla anguilla]|uniref:myelin-associated glycoprotein-like n=1 Tax=Anguilla anguilla TaxID=7936 RepID=UPI0015AA871B|nr:myelin-associated glycoprotein-like [Anguilla anguilla]